METNALDVTAQPARPEEQAAMLLQLLSLAPVGLLELGPAGEVELLNPAAVRILEGAGIDSSLPGPALLDALVPGLAAMWEESGGAIGPVTSGLRQSLRQAGGPELHLLVKVIRPDERSTMVSIEDITTAVEHERQLSRNRQGLGLVLEQLEGTGLALLDRDGCLVDGQASLSRLLDLPPERLLGQPLETVLGLAPDCRPPWHLPPGKGPGARRRSAWCELPFRHGSGRPLWGEFVVSPTVDEAGVPTGFAIVIRDVSEQHEAHERLVHDARTDPLTGLLNRRGLEESLDSLVYTPAGPPTVASWVLLDIDHFKDVNDSLGHDAGDEVLVQVASLLRGGARDGDVVARVGGEEFVVVLPRAPVGAAAAAAERLRGQIERASLSVNGATLRVTASFGVAEQRRGVPWNEVLTAADEALYRAKETGRNRVEASGLPAGAALPREARGVPDLRRRGEPVPRGA